MIQRNSGVCGCVFLQAYNNLIQSPILLYLAFSLSRIFSLQTYSHSCILYFLLKKLLHSVLFNDVSSSSTPEASRPQPTVHWPDFVFLNSYFTREIEYLIKTTLAGGRGRLIFWVQILRVKSPENYFFPFVKKLKIKVQLRPENRFPSKQCLLSIV